MASIAPPGHLGTTLLHLAREIGDLLLERRNVDFVLIFDFLDLLLELINASSSPFSEGALGGSILRLALCRRCICGRLPAWFWSWWDYPFLGGD
jgi:hypothetical protein